MGVFGDIGDGLNSALGYGEHLYDEGKKKLGEAVDYGTDKLGGALDHAGLRDWAESNAQDLWIGLGRGASRNAKGVPSRVID